MELHSLLVLILSIHAAINWRLTAGPGHARQKKKKPDVRECVSEDAEGRSGVVPLMVSARELKCIPLTEPGARKLLPSSAFAEKRKRTDELVPGGQ